MHQVPDSPTGSASSGSKGDKSLQRETQTFVCCDRGLGIRLPSLGPWQSLTAFPSSPEARPARSPSSATCLEEQEDRAGRKVGGSGSWACKVHHKRRCLLFALGVSAVREREGGREMVLVMNGEKQLLCPMSHNPNVGK